MLLRWYKTYKWDPHTASVILRQNPDTVIIGIMINERLLILTLTCYVFVWIGNCDDLVGIRSIEDDIKAQEEKELVRFLMFNIDYD